MADVAISALTQPPSRFVTGLKRGGVRLWLGGAIVIFLIIVALLAPILAPHDPSEQDLMSAQLPPAWMQGGDSSYLLGTDSLGRCVLSRLIYASRVAVVVGFVAALLAGAIGIALGLIAGSFGGWVDQLTSRLIDVWMAFPPILLSIVLAAVIGAGLTSVILAIVVVDWTRFARVVRAETAVQLSRDYAMAARVVGMKRGQILRLEILPNLVPLVVTLLAVEMGIAILVEVILSFVGISVAGDTPTWGGMIAEGRQIVYQSPWIMTLAIGCVIVSVVGFNLLGDGLRAALDPVQRRWTEVLSIRDLRVSIGHGPRATNVLRGVSLSLQPGEVRGLVGESGAGKSMLGRAVLGLLPADARIVTGTIQFAGRDFLAMPEPERRDLLGRRIALIPQDPMTSLNPVKRVGVQIAMVLQRHLALSRRAALQRATELLTEVAIRDPQRVLELYPHEISGGMRQRVLIAMAFACDPDLIIADEPTTALDVTVQRQVLQLIARLRERHNAAILFVTHDLGVVAKICRTMTVMHAGRVLEDGETADVLVKPRHPYTRALLAATPRADRPADALRPVPSALIESLWSEAHRIDRLPVAEPT